MNANQLKLVAAAAMAADHIGYFLFPQVRLLRLIGRLSYPIFASFIWEGCGYTHNKLRYFLRVALLGLVCMAVTFLFDGVIYGNILITFSLSLVMLCELKKMESCKAQGKITANQVYMAGLFLATVALVYWFCGRVEVDYGFYGVLAPVLAQLASMAFWPGAKNEWVKVRLIPLAGFAAGLVCAALHSSLGAMQFFSLAALPLLTLYDGKRGKSKLGTFFYLFYPAHIALIQLIAMAADFQGLFAA